jgi:WD40 repeat protein
VALGDTYAIRLWDTLSGKEFPKLQDNEIQWTAAFTPDGRRLVSGASGKFNLWDLATQKRIYSCDVGGKIGYVQTLAISPDSRQVATQLGMAGQELQLFGLPKE